MCPASRAVLCLSCPVGLDQHPDLTERNLSSLRKAYYGASIMPGPVLGKLRRPLPDLGLYNCFGTVRSAPPATVLLCSWSYGCCGVLQHSGGKSSAATISPSPEVFA